MSWKDTIRDIVGSAEAAESIAAYGPDRLSAVPEAELRRLPHVGPTRARRIRAALELAHEVAQTKQWRGKSLSCSVDVYRELCWLRDERTECMLVLCLDARNRLVRDPVEVARGGSQSTRVDPISVLMPVAQCGAPALILVHNHPSGSPEPSAQDIALTRALFKACDTVGLRLLDHVIIGDGRFESLEAAGHL